MVLMTTRTRKSTQPKPEETAPQAEVEASAEETTEAPEPTVEELKAQLEALKAQLAAKPVRAQREVKPTPKQLRFLRALIADPTKSVPELCTEAGATETSHGFVFRMLEHGYLRVSIPEDVVSKYSLTSTEEGETSAESAEGGSEEPATESA